VGGGAARGRPPTPNAPSAAELSVPDEGEYDREVVD